MELFYRYREWVRKHGNALALAETGLSTLTWLLPDRFNDNELSLEAIHTSINLISALHDSILNDPGPGAPHGASELTFALSALQQVQVLVELWGLYNERNGTIDSHYDPLIAVEGLKAIVRLAILRTSGCRILSNGGATTFDAVLGGAGAGYTTTNTSSNSSSSNYRGAGTEARAKEVFRAFAAFRDKHCFPATTTITTTTTNAVETTTTIKEEEEKEEKQSLWWEEEGGMTTPFAAMSGQTTTTTTTGEYIDDSSRAVKAIPSAEALRLLERRSLAKQAAAAQLIISGELLHILRPLLYVAALRRWGRRSWKPWMISLVVELASGRLAAAGATASHRAAAEAARDPVVAGTALASLYGMQGVRWRREEADELTRRKLMILYALVRDPFFSRFTEPAVERWRARVQRIPLIGRVAEKAAEVLVGVQKYYSYTAAS